MKKKLLLFLVLILGYSTLDLKASNESTFLSVCVKDEAGCPLPYAKVFIFSLTRQLLAGGNTDTNGVYRWTNAQRGVLYYIEVSMIGYDEAWGEAFGGYGYNVKLSGEGIIVKPTCVFNKKIFSLFRSLAILPEKIGIKELFT